MRHCSLSPTATCPFSLFFVLLLLLFLLLIIIIIIILQFLFFYELTAESLKVFLSSLLIFYHWFPLLPMWRQYLAEPSCPGLVLTDFEFQFFCQKILFLIMSYLIFPLNPLNPKLNPICYLLALLGAHHFLHVSRIRVRLLTFRLLMSYIYIYIWH